MFHIWTELKNKQSQNNQHSGKKYFLMGLESQELGHHVFMKQTRAPFTNLNHSMDK